MKAACARLRRCSLFARVPSLSRSFGGSCTPSSSGTAGPAGSWGRLVLLKVGRVRQLGRMSVLLVCVPFRGLHHASPHALAEPCICVPWLRIGCTTRPLCVGSRSSSCWSIWVAPWLGLSPRSKVRHGLSHKFPFLASYKRLEFPETLESFEW